MVLNQKDPNYHLQLHTSGTSHSSSVRFRYWHSARNLWQCPLRHSIPQTKALYYLHWGSSGRENWALNSSLVLYASLCKWSRSYSVSVGVDRGKRSASSGQKSTEAVGHSASKYSNNCHAVCSTWSSFSGIHLYPCMFSLFQSWPEQNWWWWRQYGMPQYWTAYEVAVTNCSGEKYNCLGLGFD